MPAIIRDLPYFDQATHLEIRGHSFLVKPYQAVLWISISEKGLEVLAPRTPRIPAILDPGCNYNLLINQRQLTAWAGIHAEHLRKLASIRVFGERVPQFAANVWLHPNVPGQRDEFAARPPFQLELLPGIAVYPAKEGQAVYPRLPLLGCVHLSGPVCTSHSIAIDAASTSARRGGSGCSGRRDGLAMHADSSTP